MNRRLKIFLLGCTQLTLLAVFFIDSASIFAKTGIALSVLLISFYYSNSTDKKGRISINSLEVAYLMLGAIIAFILNNYADFGPVLASSLVGFVASFIPNLFKHSKQAKSIPIIIYCGSFVGMSSSLLFDNALWVAGAALISGVTFQLTKGVLDGYGGKAGTIAFTGVIVMSLILVAC